MQKSLTAFTLRTSLFWFLCFSEILAQPAETPSVAGVLEGIVIDRITKQEVVGAKLQLLDAPFGTTSDANGRFRFSGVPAKTYRLKVTALDYKPLVRSDVFVGSVQSTKLTIELQLSETASADEVTVTADMFFTKQADLKVSTNTLSQEEVRRAPGAVEDVSRMVLVLPGVTSSADNRNDLVVRGGSPIENFIFVDGIEYFPEEDLKISIEAYYKRYLNYAASIDIPQLSYANAGANFGTFGLEELTSESIGYSRGVDFFMQKNFRRSFMPCSDTRFPRFNLQDETAFCDPARLTSDTSSPQSAAGNSPTLLKFRRSGGSAAARPTRRLTLNAHARSINSSSISIASTQIAFKIITD